VTSTIAEIIFEVSQDDLDGGSPASALGSGIHTQGATIEEGRAMRRAARQNEIVFQTGSQQRTEYGGRFPTSCLGKVQPRGMPINACDSTAILVQTYSESRVRIVLYRADPVSIA